MTDALLIKGMEDYQNGRREKTSALEDITQGQWKSQKPVKYRFL